MHIGLDARTIFSPKPRGTGRNLWDAYRLIPQQRPDWRFTLFHQQPAALCPLPRDSAASAEWPGNVRTLRGDLPGDRWQLWQHLFLPAASWWEAVDLLHCPANTVPTWSPVPFVATIHDLIPLRVAEEATPRQRREFRHVVSRAVRGAAHVITPSRATRDELSTEFHVPLERITVIPWAPDAWIGRADRATDAVQREVRARYGLDRKWLLHFAGSRKRKNAAGVIHALAYLPVELRHRYQVLLVGCASATRAAELEALAGRLGVSSSVRIVGFVPHEDLPELLRGAAALLMPSHCEGFGLPILDAFVCGVPVLTSNCSSMPEVAGDAAVYCDPQCPASIASGIEQVLREDVATALREKGLARGRQFSWAATAAAMCAVYERAAATVGRSLRGRKVAACP
jgi:alpha-1,3-rhamnosyl/mannosyltransferase